VSDKWLGLAPGTAEDIVALYRSGFDRVAQDGESIEQGFCRTIQEVMVGAQGLEPWTR